MILLDTNHVSILRMPPSDRRTRLVERMTLAHQELFGIPIVAVVVAIPLGKHCAVNDISHGRFVSNARSQRMATVGQNRATLDDLYRTPEKAELIGGRIVSLMSTGRKPGRVGGRIYRSLDDYSQQNGGEAFPDNVGFAVPLMASGRESFSPDASWHKGPFPSDPMRFIEGAPTCAVEVRSENDYGPSAEAEMADKRAEYFLAGTEVVWDVDTLAECIHVYRAADPDHPVTYRRGDTAEAEPAVPGWSVPVDWIFL